MVDVVKSMADYLTAHPSITYPVYQNSRPRDVDECITLVLDGGANSTFFFGYLKAFVRPMVIVYVRSKSYPDGFAQTGALVEALKSYNDIEHSIDGSRMLGNISSLGYDDQRRQELMCVYSILAEE